MVAVNLLPWRQRRRQQQRRQSLAVLGLMLACVVLVVLHQVWRIHEARQRTAQASGALQQALETIGQQLAQQKQQLEQLAALQKQQAKQYQQVAQLAAWQQFWLDLPALLPDTAWLTRLEKRDNRLTLEGLAQDMAAVQHFRQQLSAQPLLGRVEQGGVRRQAEGHYRFSLRAQVQEMKHD